jgi:hypothetical protein
MSSRHDLFSLRSFRPSLISLRPSLISLRPSPPSFRSKFTAVARFWLTVSSCSYLLQLTLVCDPKIAMSLRTLEQSLSRDERTMTTKKWTMRMR